MDSFHHPWMADACTVLLGTRYNGRSTWYLVPRSAYVTIMKRHGVLDSTGRINGHYDTGMRSFVNYHTYSTSSWKLWLTAEQLGRRRHSHSSQYRRYRYLIISAVKRRNDTAFIPVVYNNTGHKIVSSEGQPPRIFRWKVFRYWHYHGASIYYCAWPCQRGYAV